LERSGSIGASCNHLNLGNANYWIIFTHPPGLEKAATPTPPIPKGAQRILYTKGKAGRERGWWRTGSDKLATYGLDTKVWISQNGTISDSNIIALEAASDSSGRNPKKIFRICDLRG